MNAITLDNRDFDPALLRAEAVLQRIRQLVFELCRRYPVYGERGTISPEA
jgi:hypothetical protein